VASHDPEESMNMNLTRRALIGACCVAATGTAFVVANAASADEGGAIHASATIVGAPTATDPAPVVGVAKFVQDSNGVVHINVKAAGLPAGRHGLHIHAVGACTPTFAAAGGHFNPTGAAHGAHVHGDHAAHHAGDLPNLIVNPGSRGSGNTASAHFALTADVTNSLFDGDGSAIVIHANEDDFTPGTTETGPGNSGARIACGVITPG
jgi:Cu-Zn family superoxide dismutase